jgi:cytochrome c-type biogenesis protein CcmF
VKRKTLIGYPRGMLGMAIAHFGVGMFVLGITGVSSFSIEKDVGMKPGESITIEGYTFTFEGTRNVQGPNYSAIESDVRVTRDGEEVALLKPQKRTYRVQQSPMTEAAIHARLSRDLFVAMGEPLGQGAWSMRIQYKPMIRLIWLGALVMAFAGIIAASDRRYRVRQDDQVPAGAAAAGRSA